MGDAPILRSTRSLQERIRRYWAIHHPATRELRWQQRGGGLLRINGRTIRYRTEQSGNTTFLYGGGNTINRVCLVLELNRSTGEAVLQNVEGRTDCYTDAAAETSAKDIVRAAHRYAIHQRMRTIELTDNSTIRCPDKLTLSDLSFLTTGRTWYESLIPGLVCTDCPEIEIHRAQVRQAAWRDIGADLIALQMTLDPAAPGTAMQVLSAMKTSKQFCGFFKQNMAGMLFRNRMPTLMGTHWIAPCA